MDLIKRTFQHIKGINPKKEKLLWEEGVFDWQDAIEKIDYCPNRYIILILKIIIIL